MKKTSVYLITMLLLTIVSCSNDESDIDLPTVDDITNVVIAPTEVKFNEIGQTQMFTAKAYDKDGLEIRTSFDWSSSNDNVVSISSNGMAEAVSLGNAMLYATANNISDSANVEVDLSITPTIWWAAAKDGDWNEASNWNTGIVPSETDTVAIVLEGDYTVSLSSNVTVAHIMLGASEGTQRLVTGNNELTIIDGEFSGGAELNIAGSTLIKGDVNWKDGDIMGEGTLKFMNTANVQLGFKTESKITFKTTILNEGKLNILPHVSINIDGSTLENKEFATIDILGDNNSFTTLNGATFLNNGNLLKSAGNGITHLNTSDAGSFVNKGYLYVESGILNLRDGELDGVIEITENAVLRQSGYSQLTKNTIQRGDGEFEIGGSITLGQDTGDVITLANVFLNSNLISNSIHGPGDLKIGGSFLWKSGSMIGEGEVFCYGGTRLEGSGWKEISERTFRIEEALETESLLDLRLKKGAQIVISNGGHWAHNGGGTIRQVEGEQSLITINDAFTKEGYGTLTIETDFSCAKTMKLEEGVLTVKGAFELQETGTLIGGGTDISSESKYRRLQVPDASSAVLAGVIDLDADGEQAYMSILGAVSIKPTFKVLVDIKKDAAIAAERLTFKTGNTSLSGTLAVSIHGANPPENVEYQVVSAVDGKGSFSKITGAEWFTEIRQDDKGVALIRN